MNDRLGDSESLNVYGILYSLMGDDEVVIWNDQLSLEIMKSVNNNEGLLINLMNARGIWSKVGGVCINLILQFGFGRSIVCPNIPLDNCRS